MVRERLAASIKKSTATGVVANHPKAVLTLLLLLMLLLGADTAAAAPDFMVDPSNVGDVSPGP